VTVKKNLSSKYLSYIGTSTTPPQSQSTDTPTPSEAPPNMESLALEDARRGWRVFPIWPMNGGQCTCGHSGQKGCKPGKHPAITEWQKKATTDPEQIHRWWTQWPEAGIAIATGQGV
jgi:hypothetical protein